MQIPFVDLKAQYLSIKSSIDEAIQSCIDDMALIGGQYVRAFEEAYAAELEVKHCIGVANGTDALFVVLKSLGIGEGDEVITVANSFVATSEAITAVGAKVVFVDCHPDFYTIDVSKIEAKITSNTKAIIPVHLYGQPADMVTINGIAQKYGLKVVEDAAQAHLAELNGRKIGGWGDAACYSFYPGKNLGAYGDAGAILTNDDVLAKRCRMMANHGRVAKYDHVFEGYSSRLDGLQAAVLSVKLPHLKEWSKKRKQVAAWYNAFLEDTNIVLPHELEGTECVYHLYVVRVNKRDELRSFLKERGISTGIHYPIGLPYLRAYEYLGQNTPEHFPVTYTYQSQLLSFPIYPELRYEEVEYIANTIKKFFKR